MDMLLTELEIETQRQRAVAWIVALTANIPRRLRTVLAQARAENARLTVSGMLLYSEGMFVQAIEAGGSREGPVRQN